MRTIRVVAVVGLCVFSGQLVASHFERLSDSERIARRFDATAAAERRAAAIAEGRIAKGGDGNVVVGARNPELLMAWELMNHVEGVLNNPLQHGTMIANWDRRGAAALLGDDYLARLRAAVRPFLDANAELARLKAETSAAGSETQTVQARLSQVNHALCGLRADALEAARVAFGREEFQRFLYEIVAPDAVIISGSGSSPEETLTLWQWVEGGCR